MITKPTTLILGAGASKPYGFPTGYLRENLERLGFKRNKQSDVPYRRAFVQGTTLGLTLMERDFANRLLSSRDPIEEQGGAALLVYVHNNPLGSWDYLGLSTGCGKCGPDVTRAVQETLFNIADTYNNLSVGKKMLSCTHLLDPVNTLRSGSGKLTPNVYFTLDIYQKNGCYGGRCPGPSDWYKGEAVSGAANVDVTNDRPSSPVDGVPVNMTPDHVHLMSDYHGYSSAIGLTLWFIPGDWP